MVRQQTLIASLALLLVAPAVTVFGSEIGVDSVRAFAVCGQDPADPPPEAPCTMCYETCVYYADVERLECLDEADGFLDRLECHGERLVHWVLCGAMYPNCYMVENPCLYEAD